MLVSKVLGNILSHIICYTIIKFALTGDPTNKLFRFVFNKIAIYYQITEPTRL